jgi:hypothetical protein
MRETRQSGSEGGEGSLPDPYHVFTGRTKDVDGRHKGGHDDEGSPAGIAASIPGTFHRTAGARSRP